MLLNGTCTQLHEWYCWHLTQLAVLLPMLRCISVQYMCMLSMCSRPPLHTHRHAAIYIVKVPEKAQERQESSHVLMAISEWLGQQETPVLGLLAQSGV